MVSRAHQTGRPEAPYSPTKILTRKASRPCATVTRYSESKITLRHGQDDLDPPGAGNTNSLTFLPSTRRAERQATVLRVTQVLRP